jgi:hypothetical protein
MTLRRKDHKYVKTPEIPNMDSEMMPKLLYLISKNLHYAAVPLQPKTVRFLDSMKRNTS